MTIMARARREQNQTKRDRDTNIAMTRRRHVIHLKYNPPLTAILAPNLAIIRHPLPRAIRRIFLPLPLSAGL